MIAKIVNIVTFAVIVVIILFTNLTESRCYISSPSGQVLLNEQNFTGWDFITEKDPPKPLNVDGVPYSFEEYRIYTLVLLGTMIVLMCMQAFKVSLITTMVLTGGFALCFWMAVLFAQYPNYYFEQCVQRTEAQGLSSTIDSNTPVFEKLLPIAIGLLLLNWIMYFRSRKRNKPAKPWSTELLDNNL
ncbi:MAG TPA: hypothetical protein VK151_08210 [Fluviicola sp.]|nr:hypothetical protein [Fluviicola sp.]